ncbi:MAG: hypothetical protein ACRD1E_03160, partial [Terriglobales bacterium]
MPPPELLAELKAWLPQQRWYGARSAPAGEIGELDRLGPARLIEIGAPPARYLLTALDTEAQRQPWFTLMANAARLPGARGELVFEPLQPLGPAPASHLLGAEQSNTSIRFGDWLLKLIRRLYPGENPDFEVPHALAAHTGFRHLAAPGGRVLYRGGEAAYTLAVLQPFIANHGDGWEWVRARLKQDAGPGALAAELRQLGRRTAELHAALAAVGGLPDFAPEPVAAADLE